MSQYKLIAKNKKALFDYEVIETLEVGIKLLGPEVKSLRQSKCNLKGSFCKFFKGELFLFDAHISRYLQMDRFSKLEEKRTRKLLLNSKELDKWYGRVQKEKLVIVPLSIYFNEKGKVKLEVFLGKGKKLYDKRQDDKDKEAKKVTREW